MAIPVNQLERLRTALAPRYRVLKEIGGGGMAIVYLAEDEKHGRQVAVKVLRPDLAASLGPERFLREIRIAAHLAHPHILPLHDSGEADGFLYYVMPFVEGETLRDRLTRERQLPVEEAVRITQEVADGLDHAHGLGVVHRDIKPENILFMGGHAVIADFGVASAVDLASGEQLTRSGWSVGTPAYMSPEQAAGQAGLDRRTDIYSLGSALYEMLAGEPPYHGLSPQAVLAKKLHEPPPHLRYLRGAVSQGLDDAVRRSLAITPADRFDTAGAFARAAARGVGDAPPRAARRRMTLAALGAGLLLMVAGGIFWRLRSGPGDALPAVGESATIAVLPFENLGPPENEYFPIGITDEITTRLGGVSGISVVPRRAAQRYARPDMTMREIARSLRVDYLLVGSVRWDEQSSESKNIRITLQLLQARNERQLWATTYDRVIDDIFEVQSDIAGQVVERLGVALSEDERSRLRARPTVNHEAFTLYLKGRFFWNKRTEQNIQIALGFFQRAVEKDPGFALAWAGSADVWIFRGWYSMLAPRETFPKARAAVLQALAFDSTLAEAHASLAHIHLEFDYDWNAAEREYRRAIQLNPKYPTAHHWYGGFLSAMGRHEEALRQAETARQLDPLSLIIQTWMGLRYYMARQYDAAIAEYLKALELDRDFAPAHWHLGWTYEQTGELQKAVAEAERAMVLDPENLLYLASLGRAQALAGQVREARATLRRLAGMSTHRHVSAYHVSLIHLALGELDAAMTWLERAYDERSPWIGYLRVDPRLDPVRTQSRYRQLLAKARLES